MTDGIIQKAIKTAKEARLNYDQLEELLIIEMKKEHLLKGNYFIPSLEIKVKLIGDNQE